MPNYNSVSKTYISYTAFLSDLAPNAAAATQDQAFNALLFFYRNVIGTNAQHLKATNPR